MGCVPRVDRSAGGAEEDRDVNGAGIPPAGRCRKSTGTLRRRTRTVDTSQERGYRCHTMHPVPTLGFHAGTLDWTNVHPAFAVNPLGPTTKEPFAPGALYEIKIDTNGDDMADITYSAQFASSEDGKQTATLRRVNGTRAAGVCDEGDVIIEGAPVSVAREALVAEAGDYRAFFGWR